MDQISLYSIGYNEKSSADLPVPEVAVEIDIESTSTEFGDIYQRLTARFVPDPTPQPMSPRVLAIGQAGLAFLRLQDTLERLVGLFEAHPTWLQPKIKREGKSLEQRLDRLRHIAIPSNTLWQRDLSILIARADALVEMLDFIFLARSVSRKSLSLLDLPESNLTTPQIAQFAEQVTRLDAAFYALGAHYVLDCHEKGLGLDGQPRFATPPDGSRVRSKRRPRSALRV